VSREEPAGRRVNRPRRWVVALATLLLILGIANLAKGSLAVADSVRLPELPMSISWEYLAATGFFWGLALSALSFCLAGFYRWARVATLTSVTAFQVHVWATHLLFDANEYAHSTWPRDLVLTAALLAAVWVVLCWPGVRREFGSE